MPLFEERERGYEAKWVHDQEMHFRVMARRDLILGEWAAGLLKLPPTQSADYAKAIVMAGMTAGKDPIFEKLRNDLSPAMVSEQQIIAKMKEAFETASKKVAAA
jgi:hypothetical protein